MFEHLNVPSHLIPTDPRFGSGPSLIPVEHLKAIAESQHHLFGTSHRQNRVKTLVGEAILGIRNYFQLPSDYQVVLGNGGATLLFDMIGLGLVEKKAAHFTCGEFSQKWFKAANKIPWIKAQEFTVEYGQGVIPHDVEDADMICTTLNETSTGVQLHGLPKVADGHLLAVDATSGAGQVPCSVSDTDIFFFSPQKVFASEGGLFIAILSPKAIDRLNKIASDKGRYIPEIFNWKYALENSMGNQTYNTPSIITIFLLNEQLKKMNQLGYQTVCEMAQKKANLVYNWAENKPYLEPFIKDKNFRSMANATINIDERFPLEDFLKALRREKIVYDIEGYRKLGKNQVRISLFHNVTYENLERLTGLISWAVESLPK